MIGILITFLLGFNFFVGFYYGVVNLVYSILLTIALFVITRHIKRIKYSAIKDFRDSPETPPISILISAYNEEQIILQTVRSALAMNYPFFDVIVINDGSKDSTLDMLIHTYNLKKIDIVYRDILKTSPVKGVYYNSKTPNLFVIDKVKSGKADALNCGINVSRNPYYCSVDADSVLEKDALIRLMAPIMESTKPVVACGGVVRVLNGIEMKDGEITKIQLPGKMLILFQIVEYLRAFLFGRVGWNTLNGILILSGTFSLFHKASVIAVGGYNIKMVSEDMELVVKLHRYHRKNKKPYKISFISDPICWSEVPETLTMLARQRRRWHMGLVQSIIEHRGMMFNPRYGFLGLVLFPYYFFFEMLGPIIELMGYIVVPLSFFSGLLSVEYFILFLILAIFYGIFLSAIAIFMEEMTYKRYPKWSDLFRLLFYGIIENFGYRQLNSFWRFQSIIQYILGKRQWEYIEHKGKNSKEKR
jgi:cellulose synthase/poly-beta-1,6-N-acetylglucosamine synthase-like glycosyltransferase